ncbi:MAG: metallophosphoesterase [Clostridia bacterium]|nr:metallophosphoesterase [Clostridia bacterium]
MKKLLAFLLAAIMIVSLVACTTTQPDQTLGTSDTSETSDTTESSTSETTTQTTTAETTTTETTKEEETTTETQIPETPVTPAFDETKIVLTFAAISDTQHKYSGIDTLAKLRTALKQLKDYANETADGLDAVFFVGDLVQSAKSQEVREFKTAYEAVIDPVETPLIFSLGNHDVKCASYTVEDLTTDKFYEIFGMSYRAYDKETSRVELGCTHTIVNGYHFLCLNPINSSYIAVGDMGTFYTDEVKAWLDETLAAITEENPDQYVFVNTHPMIYDTTYGSTLVVSDHQWFTKDLTSILEKYNQVVTFGGHVHFPLNDPRSIMQTAFTSLGCASVTYMAIENGGYENMSSATVMRDSSQYSQGLICQVDENGNMRFTRMDFHNEDTIETPWEIPAPAADGSHLTYYGKDRADDNTAPVLSELRAVMGKVNKTGKQQVTLEFTKAEDDEFAHHYVLTLKNKTDGTTVKSFKFLADFYLHAKTADMKETYSQNAGLLSPGIEYEATLVAYDSWGAESETKSITFSITGETIETKPASVYVDIDFTNGTITDTKGNVTIQNNATVTKTEVKVGGKTATVDALVIKNSDQNVTCTFNKLTNADQMAVFAEGGFSVEAFYVMGQKGSVQGVVCGTEAGGWGVAEDKEGKPYFITGITGGKYNTGSYAKATASTEELVHVVAVYDFENKKQMIYINGVLESTQTIQNGFGVGAEKAFNMFCLGADVKKDGSAGDFLCPAMVMVDAKIYEGALTADEAKTAYNNAIANVK